MKPCNVWINMKVRVTLILVHIIIIIKKNLVVYDFNRCYVLTIQLKLCVTRFTALIGSKLPAEAPKAAWPFFQRPVHKLNIPANKKFWEWELLHKQGKTIWFKIRCKTLLHENFTKSTQCIICHLKVWEHITEEQKVQTNGRQACRWDFFSRYCKFLTLKSSTVCKLCSPLFYSHFHFHSQPVRHSR